MSIEWNGEGLPPIGCDCEVNDERTDSWSLVGSVLAHACVHGRDVAVFQIADYIGYSPTDRFRPIRTEAERKREEVSVALFYAINWNHQDGPVSESRMEDYRKAYDAIAAGKIPHITLK